jgi:hypothetical protein
MTVETGFNWIESRGTEWEGHVAHIEEMRSAQNIVVIKPEGKKQFGGSSYRWEDNINLRINLDVNWIKLDQNKDQW